MVFLLVATRARKSFLGRRKGAQPQKPAVVKDRVPPKWLALVNLNSWTQIPGLQFLVPHFDPYPPQARSYAEARAVLTAGSSLI